MLSAIEAFKFEYGLRVGAFHIKSRNNISADDLSRSRPKWLTSGGVEREPDVQQIKNLFGSLKNKTLFKGIQAAFRRFGKRKGLIILSPIEFNVYNNALATSSKKTYKTGTNHFRKFMTAFPKLSSVHFPILPPSQHILTLCFFSVALFLKKSIKSSRTIRSYI